MLPEPTKTDWLVVVFLKGFLYLCNLHVSASEGLRQGACTGKWSQASKNSTTIRIISKASHCTAQSSMKVVKSRR